MKTKSLSSYLRCFILVICIYSCKSISPSLKHTSPSIDVTIDLVEIIDDQIKVTFKANHLAPNINNFFIPEIVPGTYSDKDYGQYIEHVKAYDDDDKEIKIEQKDKNTWFFPKASKLHKITYLVSDVFDREIKGEAIGGLLATAGTSFEKESSFYLNLHSIIGYLENSKDIPYTVTIKYPSTLSVATSLKKMETKIGSTYNTDIFYADRYFSIIDNPMLYNALPKVDFKVGDMDVQLNMFTTSKKLDVLKMKDMFKNVMEKQMDYLGDIETTTTYSILLFGIPPAIFSGFGALEHHTSTMAVFNDDLDQFTLEEMAKNTISHEFFHIITPLRLHSEYIHDFEYNSPKKMSKHLWLYEGLTEYFSDIFQVNQKLISEKEFYERINEKISISKSFKDDISFTEMSEYILTDRYKDQYMNVYAKGALIAMALDIQLRELSNGKEGILALIKKLSKKYGPDAPFKDDYLIEEIVKLSDPKIGDFFTNHVLGTIPISYQEIFEIVGLKIKEKEVNTSYLTHIDGDNQTVYFDFNSERGFFFGGKIPLNSWLINIGIEEGDSIVSINGINFNRSRIGEIIKASLSWKAESEITIVVNRNGTEIIKKGKATVTKPSVKLSFIVAENTISKEKKELRYHWIYN